MASPSKTAAATRLAETIQAYRSVTRFSNPESVRILRHNNSSAVQVASIWTQRDLSRMEKLSLSKSFLVDREKLATIHASPFAVQEKSLWDVYSPSGTLRAICTQKKETDGQTNFFVQIWRQDQLVKTINLTEKKVHGDVYENDHVFGCFEWSNHEGHLLYTAERKKTKSTSYFSVPSVANSAIQTEEPGREYIREEDYGEQLECARFPILYTLDTDTETITLLENVPESLAPGQAIWCPDDSGILFVGFAVEPVHLGLIYCRQRRCAVYHIDFGTSQCNVVGHAQRSVLTPRFSPNGKLAVWLEQESGSAHMHCQRLIACDWETKEIRVVIEVVGKAGTGFPGLNSSGLIPRCWASDNRRLLISSVWRSHQRILLIDIEAKLGIKLATSISVGAANVLDVHEDVLVAKLSSPTQPHYLAVARVPDPGKEDSVRWCPLQLGVDVASMTLDSVLWKVLRHVPDLPHPEYGAAEFESILIVPTRPVDASPPVVLSDEKGESEVTDAAEQGKPLIVWPHGGPHSVFVAEFNLYVAGFVSCGFACLLVNYRGSWGFGQDSIRTLLGNIGRIDVADCYQATQEALSNGEDDLHLDPKSVVLFGGSHGGYLSAHLISRYPDVYRAAVCRNPVINLASMVGSTDIPDWCYVEAGLQWQSGRLLTGEDLAVLWEMSPLRYADGVKGPVLIIVGQKDRRVPMQQGLELHRALLSRGVPTRLLLYPNDGHPISSVPAEADGFVQTVQWFIAGLGGGVLEK